MLNRHNKSIKVNRLVLLDKLKENLLIHTNELIESNLDYRKAIIQFSNNLITALTNDDKVEPYFKIQPPLDHTKEYQEAIDMLEYSVDEVIELGEELFKAYIKNEWSWSEGFNSYKTTLKGFIN